MHLKKRLLPIQLNTKTRFERFNFMKKITAIFFGLLLLFAGTKAVNSYEYPVPELGNCRDRQECHLYCEVPNNKPACWAYNVYAVGTDVLGDESPETKVAALGITFPITELGNCANVAACKTFCVDLQNQAVCREFAVKHGLANKEKIIDKAKLELGCTTTEECRQLCELETNRSLCRTFAKKYHLKGAVKNLLVESAKNELGCTNHAECRLLCEKPENREKCVNLARRLGRGDTRKEELILKAKESLGCTSFEDCKSFCQNPENAEKCRNFGAAVRQHVEDKVKNELKEKLGCTTAEECRKVCETNPERCPNFPKLGGSPNPLMPNLKQKLDNRGPGSLNSGPKNLNTNRQQPGIQFPKPFVSTDNNPSTKDAQEAGESGNPEE